MKGPGIPRMSGAPSVYGHRKDDKDMTAEIDYEARVRKGAALLDEQVPDWITRINKDTLDVGHGYNCVSAQVSGDLWFVGRQELGLSAPAYADHGFDVHQHELPSGENPDLDVYSQLTGFWLEEIRKREAGAEARP